MSQRSIREYYPFRKKKLSSTFHKQNEEKTSTPAKKQKVDDGLLDSELIQATVDRLFMPQQASLVIDTETNSPIASNSRTTLDPIKSPEKSPCAPQSEEQDVFKRPVSPASKAKRKLEQAPCVKQSESKRFKDAAIFGGQQSILKWAKNTNKWNRILNPGYPNSDLIKVIPRQLPDLVLPVRLSPVAAAPSPTANSSIECKAKKRLFDADLDEFRDKLKSKATGDIRQKLNEFRESVSKGATLDVLFRSPFHRYKTREQEKRKAVANELIKLSPSKFLESRLSTSNDKPSNDKPSTKKPDKRKMKSKAAAVEEPNRTSEKPANLPKDEPASPRSLSPLNLNSPFHRYETRAQEKRKAAANELIRLSPSKFLESRLSTSNDKPSNDKPSTKKPDKRKMKSKAAAVEVPNRTPEKPANLPKDETASPRSLSPLNLNSPPAKDRGLELPKKYLQLATTFNHLETVITIMYNRQETCTFDKAKQGVQKLTKKDFDLSHLAQILTIYPNAYKLNYEKLTSIGRLNVTRNGLQLVIKPNVLSNKMIPYTSQMRRNEFNENLLRFAKKAHCDYLRSLDEPVPVDGTELVRWHPSFIFPNVSEAELPEQPVENEATRSIRKFWSKLNFEHSGDNLKPVPGAAGHMCATEGARIKIKKGVLKGLSQGFLDKVRQKAESAQLAIRVKAPKPEVEKKISDMKRLPEFVRTVQSLFAAEKKKSILRTSLIEKCCESLNSYSSDRCSELIQLANELLPDWLLILKTARGTFIKIESGTLLKSLYDRLKHSLARLEEQR